MSAQFLYVGKTWLGSTSDILSMLLHASPPWLNEPHRIWQAWSWEPSINLALILGTAAYLGGTIGCWRHAGYGRSIRFWHVAAFLSGALVLVVALISPLDALSEELFSAHMVQHLLLLLIAPLLFVLARPLLAFLWLLPRDSRRVLARLWRHTRWARTGWRWLTLAPIVWLLHAASLWIWHAPQLYEAAIRNETVHVVEHLCFFVSAWLLWYTALMPTGGRRRYGTSVLIIIMTAIQGGVLGALLTFSPTLLYPIYSTSTIPWGLTPMDDQHLAGVIMWIPSGLFYFGSAVGLFMIFLTAVEDGMQRREQSGNYLGIVPEVK